MTKTQCPENSVTENSIMENSVILTRKESSVTEIKIYSKLILEPFWSGDVCVCGRGLSTPTSPIFLK